MRTGTPCTWRGNPYPSEAAVARAARKSPAQVSQRLDANGSLDSFEAPPAATKLSQVDMFAADTLREGRGA